MKYMLMIYQNPANFAALSEDERQQVFSEVDAIMTELNGSGEWLGGEALADPSQSKVVRVSDGVPAITDGPYVESKEQLAGYCLFECATLERALEIATRWPDARYQGVELRPLMSGGDPEA